MESVAFTHESEQWAYQRGLYGRAVTRRGMQLPDMMKYSSMNILHHLHRPTKHSFMICIVILHSLVTLVAQSMRLWIN